MQLLLLGPVHANRSASTMRANDKNARKTTSSFSKRHKDAAETLESAEEAFDLIALFIERAVIVPGMRSIGLGSDNGNHAEVKD
jgi:hypothetical protein